MTPDDATNWLIFFLVVFLGVMCLTTAVIWGKYKVANHRANKAEKELNNIHKLRRTKVRARP